MLKNTTSLEYLSDHLYEICEQIELDGAIWEVECGKEGWKFVVAPESIGERVLGLFGDPEYGWPVYVNIDGEFAAHDLAPGNRRHPFYIRKGRCVAVALSPGDYDEIIGGSHSQNNEE